MERSPEELEELFNLLSNEHFKILYPNYRYSCGEKRCIERIFLERCPEELFLEKKCPELFDLSDRDFKFYGPQYSLEKRCSEGFDFLSYKDFHYREYRCIENLFGLSNKHFKIHYPEEYIMERTRKLFHSSNEYFKFQFPEHYYLDNIDITSLSLDGKFIAYSVQIRDKKKGNVKYVILIKNILENYVYFVDCSNSTTNFLELNFTKIICWHPTTSKWLAYVNEIYSKDALDASHPEGNIVIIYNTETKNFDAKFKFEYDNSYEETSINYIQWIDNGTKLLVSFSNSYIIIIDTITFQVLKKIDLNRNFISIGHISSNYILIFDNPSFLEKKRLNLKLDDLINSTDYDLSDLTHLLQEFQEPDGLNLQLWDYNLKDDLSLKSVFLQTDENVDIASISWSPDKFIIAFGFKNSRYISLYNIKNLTDIPVAKKLKDTCDIHLIEWMPNSINLISVNTRKIVCLWNTITGTRLQAFQININFYKSIQSLYYIQNNIYIVCCENYGIKNNHIVIYNPLLLHMETILACQLINYRLIRQFRRLPHELWDLIINDFGLSTMI